jgi:hypothetical protein
MKQAHIVCLWLVLINNEVWWDTGRRRHAASGIRVPTALCSWLLVASAAEDNDIHPGGQQRLCHLHVAGRLQTERCWLPVLQKSWASVGCVNLGPHGEVAPLSLRSSWTSLQCLSFSVSRLFYLCQVFPKRLLCPTLLVFISGGVLKFRSPVLQGSCRLTCLIWRAEG